MSLSPQSVTINQTGFTSFLCRAFGIPVPTLEWFYNGTAQPIVNSTHYSIFNMVEVNGSNLSIATSMLQVTDAVRSSHEGSYVCHATNNVNNLINTPENQSAFLTIQGELIPFRFRHYIDIFHCSSPNGACCWTLDFTRCSESLSDAKLYCCG